MVSRLSREKKSSSAYKDTASELLKHVERFYDEAFGDNSDNRRPDLGILVSGYSSGEFFPEQWLISIPQGKELTAIRTNVNGKPTFGCSWFGLTDAIVRLHWGRDDKAFEILAKHFSVHPDEIHALLDVLQYPVIFDGMPLQDAIDYAVYLVNVVIGRFRFVVGAPLCGGEVDAAVITPDKFTWVQRKSWKVETTLTK